MYFSPEREGEQDMTRDVCVIGTGYVGLIAAVGPADFGHNVIGVDKNPPQVIHQ